MGPSNTNDGAAISRTTALAAGLGAVSACAFRRRHQLTMLERALALHGGAGLASAIYVTRIRFRLPFDWLLIAVDAILVGHLLTAWLSRRTPHEADPMSRRLFPRTGLSAP